MVRYRRPLRLVALGDSTTCGEGVGVRVAADRTWPALLAGALGMELTCLARSGARVRDVLGEQVPPAIELRPDLVTLFIGLNDVLRSSSCAPADELTAALEPFPAAGLLVVRLHDPTELLPLPRPVRSAMLGRVGQLNAAVDVASRATGARVLDLAGLPALRRRDAWAVDRLHPSAHGHAVIAGAALGALGGGPAGGPGALPAPDSAPVGSSGRLAEVIWLTRHGLPYLAVHGRRMAPGALAAIAGR